MALGQAYIASLLGDVDNNLVRTVAGYNGGPGNVDALGQLAERLARTRCSTSPRSRSTRPATSCSACWPNYWMYQIRLGQPTPSLDQIAAHEWPRYAAQDGAKALSRWRLHVPLPR